MADVNWTAQICDFACWGSEVPFYFLTQIQRKQLSNGKMQQQQQLINYMSNSHRSNPISRLDQLLSKNQTIYNNLKSKLNEIHQSDQKINVNIKNIKPYYENQSINSQAQKQYYRQPDSSPIESEYRLDDRQIQVIEEKQQLISPRFQTDREEEFKRKYTTFQASSLEERAHDTLQSNEIQNKIFEQHQNPLSNVQITLQNKKVHQFNSCVFVPFNKLYRSPILQYKDHQTLILSRKSKTSVVNKSASTLKIIDGIKYKFKNIFTDEKQLLNNVYESMQDNEILIVGGQNCLKKKIHMSLLAFVCRDLAGIIKNKTLGIDIIVKVDHQQIQSQIDEATIKSTAFQFKDNDGQNQVNFLDFQSFLEDIFYLMKKVSAQKNQEKQKIRQKLRLTKFIVTGFDQEPLKLTIISTNRYDQQFIKNLNIQKVIWCINPLFKYYDEAKQTLEASKSYSNRAYERKTFLNL